MEDREWIRAVKRGEKEYLNHIAGKYYDEIYRFCLYQTADREEACDITQETFLRFIKSVEQYRDRNLKGYLLTIAMNLCRDYFRRKNPECRDMEEAGLFTQGDIARKETELVLLEALEKLSQEQRAAVLFHHYYGFKYREIAKMTGCGTATAKSRVRQGLEKLSKVLKEEECYD